MTIPVPRPSLTSHNGEVLYPCPAATSGDRSGGWTNDAERERVLARDGWLCHVCDRYINPRIRPPERGSACLDRFRSLEAGGQDTEWNLRATHLECVGRVPAEGAGL
jgi:hypothetical protein